MDYSFFEGQPNTIPFSSWKFTICLSFVSNVYFKSIIKLESRSIVDRSSILVFQIYSFQNKFQQVIVVFYNHFLRRSNCKQKLLYVPFLRNSFNKLNELVGWIRNRIRYYFWIPRPPKKKPERKRKKLIRLGVDLEPAYQWSLRAEVLSTVTRLPCVIFLILFCNSNKNLDVLKSLNHRHYKSICFAHFLEIFPFHSL